MIPPFTALSDDTLNDYRRRIVDAHGDAEKAGLTLADVRNMIYTKMLRVNPNIEAHLQQGEGEAKPRKARAKSTPGPTRNAADLDNLLG